MGKKNWAATPDFISVMVLFPSATFFTRLGVEFSYTHSATISVFQIKKVALFRDLNRLEGIVLSRTREKRDSTTFDVRKCFQCSRRK